MPIKVDVVDNNSTVRVRPEDNTSTVKLSSGSSIDLKRLELLVKQLQQTKQDLGFVYLDAEWETFDPYHGIIPKNMLNLLTTFLVNKIHYNGNIYSVATIHGLFYDYICMSVNPNTIRVNIESGQYEIFNGSALSHSALSNLDFESSGHQGKGFAGIKIKTTAEWNQQPELLTSSGILYVYSDYAHDELGNPIPGVKIGDASGTPLILKPFVGDNILEGLEEHINNTSIHVTQAEKNFWNSKSNIPEVLDNDMLKFDNN